MASILARHGHASGAGIYAMSGEVLTQVLCRSTIADTRRNPGTSHVDMIPGKIEQPMAVAGAPYVRAVKTVVDY